MSQVRGQISDSVGAPTVGGDAPGFAPELGGRLMPTIARWPLEVDEGFERAPWRDPWVSLVRDSIVAYREGRTDVAHWSWAADIVWRVSANGSFAEEHHGADRIFAYHQRLGRLTGGTFLQRLVALQASGGPIVSAHLRSTARRGQLELDMPTLVVFELTAGRIKVITEMPGDPKAWQRFWAD